MKIQCPNCKKSYSIKPESIPMKGAYAKCKSCDKKILIKKRTQISNVNADPEKTICINKNSDNNQKVESEDKKIETNRAVTQKKIIGIIFLSILISTFFYIIFRVSNLIEAQHSIVIEYIENNYDIKLTKLKYKKNWLNSSSELSLKFDGFINESLIFINTELSDNIDYSETKSNSFLLSSSIIHGPIIYDKTNQGDLLFAAAKLVCSIFLEEKNETPLAKYLSNMFPIQVETIVAFDGTLKTNIGVPNFQQSCEDKTITFDGLKGKLDYLSDINTVKTQFVFQGLTISNQTNKEENRFILSGFEFISDFCLDNAELKTGFGTLSIQEISFLEKEVVNIGIKSIKIDHSIEQQGSGLRMVWDLKIQEFISEDEKFGPLELTFKNKNLHAKSLRNLLEEFEFITNTNLYSKKQLEVLAFSKLLEASPYLFKLEPEIEIANFSYVFDDQLVSGSVLLKFYKDSKIYIENKEQLLYTIHFETSISFPVSFLMKAADSLLKDFIVEFFKEDPLLLLILVNENTRELFIKKQLSELVDEGLILPDGKNYRLNIDYDRGVLRLNGKIVWDKG